MPKFLISDCDYTLINFNHAGGIAALKNSSDYGLLANVFNDYFKNILAGTRASISPKFIELKSILENLSNEIVAGDEKLYDAVWSRELWAYHYLKDITNEDLVIHSQEAANIYWRGVGETSSIYEDTPLFINRIKENDFHIVLVSSSDGRLILNEEKNQLVYNPDKAKKLKTERYKLCGFGDLLDINNDLYIGDPIAKPHQVFWEKTLIDAGIESSSKNNHIVVIGDSYETDLKGAHWFKSQSILIDRNKEHRGVEKLPAADRVAHNLDEALKFIL